MYILNFFLQQIEGHLAAIGGLDAHVISYLTSFFC